MEQVLQEQFFTAVKTSQEATLHLAQTWLQAFISVTPNLFDTSIASSLDSCYGFAEKLWSTNRDFLVSLFEIASEYGKKPAG